MREVQTCGYEVVREMHATCSVVSRMETIAVRDEALKLSRAESGSLSSR